LGQCNCCANAIHWIYAALQCRKLPSFQKSRPFRKMIGPNHLFPQKQLNREEGRLLRVVENAIPARTVVEGSDWTEPGTFEKKWG
jgi:hypothetical protein